MKTIYLLVIATTLVGIRTVSADDLTTLPHWVDDSHKTVYFAPRPLLTVSVNHLGVDDVFWDQLNIDLSYDNALFTEQVDSLKAAFPGYEIDRPILEKQGDFALTFPALGLVHTPLDTRPNAVGPYFHLTKYIPKSQSVVLRAALSRGLNGALQVSGQIAVDVPIQTTVEHAELEPETCSALVKGNSTVRSVLLNFTDLRQRIRGMDLHYTSTADALEQSVLEGCFKLPSTATVTSFADILKLKVQVNPGYKPVGETQDLIPRRQTAPLYYDSKLDISGGGS